MNNKLLPRSRMFGQTSASLLDILYIQHVDGTAAFLGHSRLVDHAFHLLRATSRSVKPNAFVDTYQPQRLCQCASIQWPIPNPESKAQDQGIPGISCANQVSTGCITASKRDKAKSVLLSVHIDGPPAAPTIFKLLLPCLESSTWVYANQ